MCQAVPAQDRVCDWLTVGGNQPLREFRRRRDRNLLTKNGAHGQFKTVPRAWNPQTWPGGDERRQQRVEAEMLADRHGVSGEVEDASHAGNNDGESPQIGKANGDRKTRSLFPLDEDRPGCVTDADAPHVAAGRHCLDAWDRPRVKERQKRLPFEGRPIGQRQPYCAGPTDQLLDRSRPPKRAWGTPKQVLKNLVEPSNAAKTGCRGNLDHRQLRLMDELLCQQDAPRLRHRDRRGSEVLPKQPAELAFANSQS